MTYTRIFGLVFVLGFLASAAGYLTGKQASPDEENTGSKNSTLAENFEAQSLPGAAAAPYTDENQKLDEPISDRLVQQSELNPLINVPRTDDPPTSLSNYSRGRLLTSEMTNLGEVRIWDTGEYPNRILEIGGRTTIIELNSERLVITAISAASDGGLNLVVQGTSGAAARAGEMAAINLSRDLSGMHYSTLEKWVVFDDLEEPTSQSDGTIVFNSKHWEGAQKLKLIADHGRLIVAFEEGVFGTDEQITCDWLFNETLGAPSPPCLSNSPEWRSLPNAVLERVQKISAANFFDSKKFLSSFAIKCSANEEILKVEFDATICGASVNSHGNHEVIEPQDYWYTTTNRLE